MKKILSILLVLAMVLTCAPFAASAAETCTHETFTNGVCDGCGNPGGILSTGVKWMLIDGVLTFSGDGAMPDYRMVRQCPYYSYKAQIKEVVLESGVTTIGKVAFYECENLEKLTIKGNITTIGNNAVFGCYAIKEITYYGTTAPELLGSNGFRGEYGDLDVTVSVPEDYAEGVEKFANLPVSRTLPATGGETEPTTYEVKILRHTTDTGVAVKSIISNGEEAERATHGKDLTVVLEITGDGTVDEVYVRYISIGTSQSYYFADEDCPVMLDAENLTLTIPGELVDGTVEIDAGIMLNVVVNLEGGHLKNTTAAQRWYDADPSDDVAALSKDYAFYGYGGSWSWKDSFAREGYILKEITSSLPQHGSYDPNREIGPVLDQNLELTLVWEECTHESYTDGACDTCGKEQLQMVINSISMRSNCAGMYYGATFRIPSDMDVVRQGIVVSLYNQLPVADGMDDSCLWTTGTTSVVISDILEEGAGYSANKLRATMPIYARAYVELADGTYIYSDAVGMHLQQVTEAADAIWSDLEEPQTTNLAAMYGKFKKILRNWNIPNIKAAAQ